MGGCISVLFFGATVGYIMYLFMVMYSYDKDVQKTAVLTNNFETGFERINMNDKKMFYPSMALEPMNTAAGLNLDPAFLARFFDVVLMLRYRQGAAPTRYYANKFKRCQVIDFERNGMNVGSGYAAEIGRRICPDV